MPLRARPLPPSPSASQPSIPGRASWRVAAVFCSYLRSSDREQFDVTVTSLAPPPSPSFTPFFPSLLLHPPCLLPPPVPPRPVPCLCCAMLRARGGIFIFRVLLRRNIGGAGALGRGGAGRPEAGHLGGAGAVFRGQECAGGAPPAPVAPLDPLGAVSVIHRS